MPTRWEWWKSQRWVWGVAGALLVSFLLPDDMRPQARKLLPIFTLAIVWWLTDALPASIVSLFCASLLVITEITTPAKALASFAHPVIFLFMGGFFFAKAVEVNSLDKILIRKLLSFPFLTQNLFTLFATLVSITAFLSMWMSNTAATALVLPIAIAICTDLIPQHPNLHGKILLALAYAATIGGIATPLGTPPNILAIAFLEKLASIQVSFLDWMMYGVPFVFVSLLFLILVMGRGLKSISLPSLQISTDEAKIPIPWNLIGILVLTILLWLTPGIVQSLAPSSWESLHRNISLLDETTVAILMSSLLFLLPSKKGRPLLNWNEAKSIDWNILLFFGGGLTLGTQLFESGLAQDLSQSLQTQFSHWPLWALGLLFIYGVQYFTEVASNTATANMVLPVAISAVLAWGGDPEPLAISVAIAASLAFMLPIGTPPNALVYSTERIPLKLMVNWGIVINLGLGFFLGVLYIIAQEGFFLR